MKLWFVIYNMGLIGGTVGPLPYDMKECIERAIPYQQAAKENGISLTFKCEYHEKRPELKTDGKTN